MKLLKNKKKDFLKLTKMFSTNFHSLNLVFFYPFSHGSTARVFFVGFFVFLFCDQTFL